MYIQRYLCSIQNHRAHRFGAVQLETIGVETTEWNLYIHCSTVHAIAKLLPLSVSTMNAQHQMYNCTHSTLRTSQWRCFVSFSIHVIHGCTRHTARKTCTAIWYFTIRFKWNERQIRITIVRRHRRRSQTFNSIEMHDERCHIAAACCPGKWARERGNNLISTLLLVLLLFVVPNGERWRDYCTISSIPFIYFYFLFRSC